MNPYRSISRKAPRRAVVPVAGLALLWGLTAAAPAAVLELPGRGDLTLDLDLGPDLSLRVANLTDGIGSFEALLSEGPALGPGEFVVPDLLILDRSLEVTSSLAPGELRARYRIPYREGRLEARAIRARDLRLLRRDATTGTWRRAARALHAEREVRFLFGRRADFTLGHFGVDTKNRIVWGVMDVAGEFALGARLSVVEPAAAGLVLSGLALLGAAQVRRRRERAPR